MPRVGSVFNGLQVERKLLRLAAACQQRRHAPQQAREGFHTRHALPVMGGEIRQIDTAGIIFKIGRHGIQQLIDQLPEVVAGS